MHWQRCAAWMLAIQMDRWQCGSQAYPHTGKPSAKQLAACTLRSHGVSSLHLPSHLNGVDSATTMNHASVVWCTFCWRS